MPAKLNQYLNRTVLVSIPALFPDGKCRAYTLRGVDDHGLWLDSQHMNERLLGDDKKDYTTVGSGAFVPFAQIAGVLFVTAAPQALPPAADDKSAAAQAAVVKGKTAAKPSKGP
jgi:hypothetical protein